MTQENRPKKRFVEACCAIIQDKGRILIAQRKADDTLALHWEFPGGKVEAGESLESCVIREIQEEDQNPRGGNARRSPRGGGRRGGGGAQLASQREIDALTAARDKVLKAREAIEEKMQLEGFRIVDPDNDAIIRDRERDDGP